MIQQFSEAILTRPSTTEELKIYREILLDGYDQRRVAGAQLVLTPRITSIGVCWTNHLIPEASDRKLELKHQIDKGDPPTQRLTADWRERAEDVVWAMLNSPEFVFIP